MAGTNAVGKGYGIVNKLVRVMRTVEAKGVDHKGVNTPQQFCLVRLDGFHVGDIGNVPEAEAEMPLTTSARPSAFQVALFVSVRS